MEKKQNINNSGTLKLILIIILILLVIATAIYYNNFKQKRPIGGDKDAHGCLIGAGYSWCPSNEKCQRMWEDYCEEYKDQYKINSSENSNNIPTTGNVVSNTVTVEFALDP